MALSGKTHLYRHFCHDELQISLPLFLKDLRRQRD
jgi:hypothetical protein